MPCFDAGVLWIEMEEQDRYAVDKTQLGMACKNLQIGTNEIVAHIKEDVAGIGNDADVVNTVLGTSFSFGSEDEKTAQYTFTFEVSENCDLRLDQNEHTRTSNSPGTVKFYSQDIATVLKPRMEAEYVIPAPELARLAEVARIAEQKRIAEEAKIIEEARVAEEQRLAEIARSAEVARLVEEAQKREEERIAEAARIAELERIAE